MKVLETVVSTPKRGAAWYEPHQARETGRSICFGTTDDIRGAKSANLLSRVTCALFMESGLTTGQSFGRTASGVRHEGMRRRYY